MTLTAESAEDAEIDDSEKNPHPLSRDWGERARLGEVKRKIERLSTALFSIFKSDPKNFREAL